MTRVFLILGLGVLCVEAACLGVYAVRAGGLFYTSDRTTQVERVEATEARADVVHQLHPYFGYSVRPGVPIRRFVPRDEVRQLTEAGAGDWLALESNNFGFYSESDYPAEPEGSVIIGVFGGSVAHSFAMRGAARLRERLADAPWVANRPIGILNFSSGGFKQPQQTLILAYFLALGQRFDRVVNIDGFNESALGGINTARGVDPSLPTGQITEGLRDLARPEADLAAVRRLVLRAELRDAIVALEASQSARSFATTHLIDEWRLVRLRARQSALSGDPASNQNPVDPLFAEPTHSGGTDPVRIVEDWARASRLMATLAESVGARYLQILQPNQYASERRFALAERRIAFDPQSPYARHAPRDYPRLRAQGAALRRDGIDFHDGSAIFDTIAEPIYIDDCCHYNQRGYELLADFIAERLAAPPD